MMTNKITCLIVSLLLTTSATIMAQSSKELPENIISKQEAERQLRYLAADDLMGRKTGTPGNDSAAAFIAREFKKLRLNPAPGAQDYFQTVTLQLTTPKPGQGTFELGDITVPGIHLAALSKAALQQKAPAVLVGFGLQDDYKGIDVKGKIVIAKAGTANTSTPSELLRTAREKRKLAAAQGAIALVEIYNHSFPWQQLSGYFSRPSYSLQGNNREQDEIAHLWVNQQGIEKDILATAGDAASATINIPAPATQTIVSQNVAAALQGKDKKLNKEWVILSAHYDHVGTGMTAGAGATAEDSIFNGARDNAMGTVALLSAAKALAKNPPARSVLFLALTGEELGMLGSAYYTENPLVPLEQTVFALNTDGAGYNDTSMVTIIGLERTSAGKLIESAAAEVGLKASNDPVPAQNLFDRSDNVKFAEKGIPTINFSPGFTGFDEELMKYYHNAEDEAEYVDYNYLLRYCKAFARSARLIANMPQAPQWAPGDKYEAAGKLLYNKK